MRRAVARRVIARRAVARQARAARRETAGPPTRAARPTPPRARAAREQRPGSAGRRRARAAPRLRAPPAPQDAPLPQEHPGPRVLPSGRRRPCRNGPQAVKWCRISDRAMTTATTWRSDGFEGTATAPAPGHRACTGRHGCRVHGSRDSVIVPVQPPPWEAELCKRNRRVPPRPPRPGHAGLTPRWSATMPPVRLRQATRDQPARWSRSAMASWSGQARMDSAR